MSGGSPEVEIARLEMRAETAEKDIAELKARIEKNEEATEALRRFQAWLLGGIGLLGAILSQVGTLIADKLK